VVMWRGSCHFDVGGGALPFTNQMRAFPAVVASFDRHAVLVASSGWPCWRLLRYMWFRMRQFLLAAGRQKLPACCPVALSLSF
jgi:hypothetical protein